MERVSSSGEYDQSAAAQSRTLGSAALAAELQGERDGLHVTYLPPEDPEAVRKRDGIRPEPVGTRPMVTNVYGERMAPRNAGMGHNKTSPYHGDFIP